MSGDIVLKNVCKDYTVYQQRGSIINMAKHFFRAEKKIIHAVSNLSFTISPGEKVGLIGENGAGKSSTIKMMTGILVPSQGEIMVGERIPYKQRKENAKNIGVIFGQKSRLLWDLPFADSLHLYKEIYQIADSEYEKRVSCFIEMLEMESYIERPVRQLSLGPGCHIDTIEYKEQLEIAPGSVVKTIKQI